MEYIKKNGDREYRIVSLEKSYIPPFRDFSKESNLPINQKEKKEEVVLEVRKETGETELIAERDSRIPINYSFHGTELIIYGDHPVARLWIKDTGENGIRYKLPNIPFTIENEQKVRKYYLPRGNAAIHLVGDQYFEKVYQLKEK